MKPIFIISTLVIFSIIAVILFMRIPAGTNSSQSPALSSLQTNPTPQPSVNMQAVNRVVAQGPKNTVTQGPQRPTKVNPPTPQPVQSGQSLKFTTTSLNQDIIEIGTERHSPASPSTSQGGPTSPNKPISIMGSPLINKFLTLFTTSVIKIAEASQGGPTKPYVKLSKWDGEAMLKVHVPFNTGDNPEQIGDKLRYTGDKVKVDFYPKQPEEITQKDSLGNEHKFIINEDGGVEFDTILEEKPAVNYIVFPLETQGLKFYYQPPLNEQPPEEGLTCTATTCTKDGKITDFRPEEVIGSYAVYSDSKRDDYSQMGGKNYKTGKAFHIYRPKIKDSSGKEIWGSLQVDEQKQTLTLTIDQNWLDSASYPIIIDPIFGYDGIGGTTGSSGARRLQAQVYQAGNGTLTQIYFYSVATGARLRIGIYADYFNYPGALIDGSEQILTADITWLSYNTAAVNLAANTNYWLAYIEQENTNVQYAWDGTSPPMRKIIDTQPISAFPDPFPEGAASSTARKISMYGVYTVPPSEFKFNGLKMEGVKIQ